MSIRRRSPTRAIQHLQMKDNKQDCATMTVTALTASTFDRAGSLISLAQSHIKNVNILGTTYWAGNPTRVHLNSDLPKD